MSVLPAAVRIWVGLFACVLFKAAPPVLAQTLPKPAAPATRPAAKPVWKPAVKPVWKPVAKPAVKSAAKPWVKPAWKPVAAPAASTAKPTLARPTPAFKPTGAPAVKPPMTAPKLAASVAAGPKPAATARPVAKTAAPTAKPASPAAKPVVPGAAGKPAVPMVPAAWPAAPASTAPASEAVAPVAAATAITIAPDSLTPPARAAQPSTGDTLTKMELRRLDERWAEATLRNDAEVLSQLMAPEYVAINSRGELVHRIDILRAIAGGTTHIEVNKGYDYRIRVYGDVGIVMHNTSFMGSVGGQNTTGEYHSTYVYSRRSGRWQLVNSQTTHVVPVEVRSAAPNPRR